MSEPKTVAVASAKQNAIEARDGVIGGDETGALGDGDQRAEIVKEIDEEEDEDDFKQALAEWRRVMSSLKRGLQQGELKAADGGRPVNHAQSSRRWRWW